MSKLLGNPKILVVIVVFAVLLVLGLAGGALGNEFGGGFLGAPLPHLQLAAEPVLADELLPGWKLTNTMLATWLTILVLAALAFFATRRMKEVPSGLQSLFEVVIEFFLNLTESVAGKEKARRFFPLVMTIFIFIVAANWLGILPGFGTIGRFEPAEEVIHHAEDKAKKKGEHANLETVKLAIFEGDGALTVQNFGSVGTEITGAEYEHTEEEDRPRAGLLVPFLRSANTDINTTLAIALVAMVMIHFWAFRSLGVFGHVGKFINVRQGPIWLFVGLLEAISEIARVISFTFRLFGNIFAGEVLLFAMAFLLPLIGIMPFLGLELFVGLIQAFIFSMLTLVFASTATVAHDEGH